MAEVDGSSSDVKVTNRTLSESHTVPYWAVRFRASTFPGVAT